MPKIEIIQNTEELVEKLNSDFDRVSEMLYLVEKEVISIMNKIGESSLIDSVKYFDYLEQYKVIVSRCYYNRYP
jgi:hypothetical protein